MGRAALHVVLLAGGSGTRFWPLSRARCPKQLLALAGERTLLSETWSRLARLAPPARRWVVAPRGLAGRIRAELPRLRPDRLILEPSPRDTGPAIALACARVAAADPSAVVGFFPTDHVIRDEESFASAVGLATAAAREGALVCLGVRPDRPATGFGYLRCATRPRRGTVTTVDRFVEKPDAARARRFLRSGRYLWNGGMFVWRATQFLDELSRTQPEMQSAVAGFVAGSSRAWTRAPRLSVDYAVMERARGVRVVPLDAGWDDVGSWDAATRLRQERRYDASDAILVGSPGSAVVGGRRLIAIVDVPGVIVIDTDDALLVVARDRCERVREVVEQLRKSGRSDLL